MPNIIKYATRYKCKNVVELGLSTVIYNVSFYDAFSLSYIEQYEILSKFKRRKLK